MNDFQLKSFYQVLESDLTLALLGASLVAQTVKNPPAMLETWVRSLGWEDSLEEEMATHSRILAWRIPWIEKPGRLQSMGLQRVGSNFHFFHLSERSQSQKTAVYDSIYVNEMSRTGKSIETQSRLVFSRS